VTRLWQRILAGLLAVAALAGHSSFAAPPARPNIIFILVDTLRADHVGCYGYKRDTTPTLDRLAAEGARFDQMIAASGWTMPSVMTMFTSIEPSLHGAVSSKHALVRGVTTLAAELSKAGYQTVGFTSNPMTHSKFGFGSGFDFYDDFTVLLSFELNLFDHVEAHCGAHGSVTNPVVNRTVLSWAKRRREPSKPLFLFLVYFDPHADYIPPPPYDRMFDPDFDGEVDGRQMYRRSKDDVFSPRDQEHIRALYDGEIRHTDEHLRQLLGSLRELGIMDNALTLILSDHGEEFWDHGATLHGHTLYDELIHVPCILHWPGRIKPGQVIREQTGHIDVMPTLLTAAGVPVPQQCLGRVWPTVARASTVVTAPSTTAAPADRARPYFSETEVHAPQLRAIRTPERKIIWDTNTSVRQAYNLADDPCELRNLADNMPATFTGLSRQLDRWWQQMQTCRSAVAASESPKLSPQLLRQIKSMGYAH